LADKALMIGDWVSPTGLDIVKILYERDKDRKKERKEIYRGNSRGFRARGSRGFRGGRGRGARGSLSKN